MLLSSIGSTYSNLFIYPKNVCSAVEATVLKIFSAFNSGFRSKLKLRVAVCMLGTGVVAAVFFRHFRKSSPFLPKSSSPDRLEQFSTEREEELIRATSEGECSCDLAKAADTPDPCRQERFLPFSERGVEEQATLLVAAIRVVAWVTFKAVAVCVREFLSHHHIVTITAEILTKTDMLVSNNERSALFCRETRQAAELRNHAIEALMTAQRLFGDIERRFQQLERMEEEPSISFFTLFPRWMSFSRLCFIRALIANDAVKMTIAVLQNPYQKNEYLRELDKMAETVKGVTANIQGARGLGSDQEVSAQALRLSCQIEQEIDDIKAFLSVFADRRAGI